MQAYGLYTGININLQAKIGHSLDLTSQVDLECTGPSHCTQELGLPEILRENIAIRANTEGWEVALYVKRMWKQERVVTARIQRRHQLTVTKLTAAKGPQQPVKAARPAKAPLTAIATPHAPSLPELVLLPLGSIKMYE